MSNSRTELVKDLTGLVRSLLRFGVLALTVVGLTWLNSSAFGGPSARERAFKGWCQQWISKLDQQPLPAAGLGESQPQEAAVNQEEPFGQFGQFDSVARSVSSGVATDIAPSVSVIPEGLNLSVAFITISDNKPQEEQLNFVLGNFEPGAQDVTKESSKEDNGRKFLSAEQSIRILALLEQSRAFADDRAVAGQNYVRISINDPERSFSASLSQSELSDSLPILSALTLLRVYAQDDL